MKASGLEGKAKQAAKETMSAFVGTDSSEDKGYVYISGVQCEYNKDSKLVKLPADGTGYTTYRYNLGLSWGAIGTIELIMSVSKAWAAKYPDTKVQIGDISTEFGGNDKRHSSHTNGLYIDIRPVRKDNSIQGVDYKKNKDDYDGQRTDELISMFLSDMRVESILFNDEAIVEKYKNVKKYVRHDDHFHVKMKGS
jgi:murein endopeptidase